MILSQVPALPHPLLHHQHVMSGRYTAGLSPQAEPLAHNPSQSTGNICAQGGKEVAREVGA